MSVKYGPRTPGSFRSDLDWPSPAADRPTDYAASVAPEAISALPRAAASATKITGAPGLAISGSLRC